MEREEFPDLISQEELDAEADRMEREWVRRMAPAASVAVLLALLLGHVMLAMNDNAAQRATAEESHR